MMGTAAKAETHDTTAVVVFGLDEKGKPHASAFDVSDAKLARKAAGLMGMHVLTAGHSLGIQIYLLELRTSNELEDAFSDMVRIGVDALNVLPGPMVANEGQQNCFPHLTTSHSGYLPRPFFY
jgi:hypothetical protein